MELAGTYNLLETQAALVCHMQRYQMEDDQKKEYVEKESVLLGKALLAVP